MRRPTLYVPGLSKRLSSESPSASYLPLPSKSQALRTMSPDESLLVNEIFWPGAIVVPGQVVMRATSFWARGWPFFGAGAAPCFVGVDLGAATGAAAPLATRT